MRGCGGVNENFRKPGRNGLTLKNFQSAWKHIFALPFLPARTERYVRAGFFLGKQKEREENSGA
jgi:hypothetical protein